MISFSEKEKWRLLLLQWESSLTSLWGRNKRKWKLLDLPDVGDLIIKRSDSTSVVLSNIADNEVAKFYSVTDGWPLWLGSFSVALLPADDIGLFSGLYGDAYATAVEYAPFTCGSESNIDISKDNLREAIALTGPDAREFILSLRNGKTVFFYFDGLRVFDNFYMYMRFRKEEVHAELADMLES